jgi:hypothetical protein
MVSLKKRLVVGIALLMLLIATVVPVGAQDDNGATPPSPSDGINTLVFRIGGSDGLYVTLSLPIRCGNNC